MDYSDADDLRKYQADAAEDAPPGDDTRCAAMNPDGTVRCMGKAGHIPFMDEGVQYDHAFPTLGAWWSNPAEPPRPFCGQRDPNYPDDGCCTLPPGHDRWMEEGDGDLYDHARLDANGEMITGWNMPAEPEPRTINDQRRADGLPPWDMLRIVDDPKPVRVRFIDLPPRAVPGEVMGVAVHRAEPGGFALVVDRFKHLAHRDAEHANWDRFGEGIGAHVVLCYVGELDISSWFDPS